MGQGGALPEHRRDLLLAFLDVGLVGAPPFLPELFPVCGELLLRIDGEDSREGAAGR